MPRSLALAIAFVIPSALHAQDGTIVYRLGRDTVAVERYSRTPTRFAGEMVTRSGAAVTRTAYEFTLSAGRITAATVRRMAADGSALPNTPREYRFAFGPDSAVRTLVFADSAPSRTFAVRHAMPGLPVFIYAPFALVNEAPRAGGRRDSVPVIPLGGTNVGTIGLEPLTGDTLRLRGAPYPMLLRFGASGRLELVDGSYTTNKAIGTPGSGAVDIGAIAGTMRPTGVLSPRMTAYAAFSQGPITVNYGSPAVRGRTVWGGTLVPFDSVWRTGANEATHLATSKAIQLGDMMLAPGLYTLWIRYTRGGAWLIVNRQVGQWGTAYNPAHDIGRVPLLSRDAADHVEDFTIAIRGVGQNRGVIDFAWGDKVVTAPFDVLPGR